MINQTKQYDVLNIPCTIEDHKYPYNLPKRRYKVCHFALGHPVVHWSRKALKAQIPQGGIFQEEEPYVALCDMDLYSRILPVKWI